MISIFLSKLSGVQAFDLESILYITSFYFCLFLISFYLFNFYKKMSLWLMIKSSRLELKNIKIAFYTIVTCAIFTSAFAYSGALAFLAALPGFILVATFILGIMFSPIVFAAILAKYMKRKEDFTNSKNLLYACLYLFTISFLPYFLGFIFFSILILYTMGLVANYFWLILMNNKSML